MLGTENIDSFLTGQRVNEYRLFTLLVHQLSRFDDGKMSGKWCKHADKDWLRNQQIQDAVKTMKSEIELLEAINKRQTPAEISQPIGISGIMTEGDDLGGLSADKYVEKNGRWALAWPGQPFLP
jgi:hypothetical protein